MRRWGIRGTLRSLYLDRSIAAVKVPAGHRYEIIFSNTVATMTAGVATRTFRLTFENPDRTRTIFNTLFLSLTASQIQTATIGLNGAGAAVSPTAYAIVNDLILDEGETIVMSYGNLQTGDLVDTRIKIIDWEKDVDGSDPSNVIQ